MSISMFSRDRGYTEIFPKPLPIAISAVQPYVLDNVDQFAGTVENLFQNLTVLFEL